MLKVTTEHINCNACESPYLYLIVGEYVLFAQCLDCEHKQIVDTIDAQEEGEDEERFDLHG